MNDDDKNLVRHLGTRFGTRRFTADEAAGGDDGSGGTPPIAPGETHAWATALARLVERELAVAELEGFRLTETVLAAAGILNI